MQLVDIDISYMVYLMFGWGERETRGTDMKGESDLNIFLKFIYFNQLPFSLIKLILSPAISVFGTKLSYLYSLHRLKIVCGDGLMSKN